jgi:outer membrane receptor protein involved in Fe transport
MQTIVAKVCITIYADYDCPFIRAAPLGEDFIMRLWPLLLGSTTLALTTPVFAQQAAPALNENAQEAAPTPDIIVTAVARGQNRLETSISVSALSVETIANTAPRSVAELFRNLPGIRSESSGGEGNANISVRGLPVASGGAKFLQLQEDGLPVLEFGDITFGNADIFLRSDFNVARIESVRGGSASTFASNAPGGIINLISKTGTQEGGAIQASAGLDYGEYRLDFDYGGSLAQDLTFHFGGFYRQGEGPRRVGYDGQQGGQIKANITKNFANGYIRFYGKYLDDRAVGYLPNPVRVTGTNSDPDFENLPNFSINQDSLHSRFFTSSTTLDGRNNPTTADIRDGMRPLVKSLGFEASFDLAKDLSLINRFRFSDISGSFTSPFPAAIDTAGNTATSLGGAGASLVFASGPNSGQAANPATQVAQIVLFNTRLNSLDNITNDLRLNYSLSAGQGQLDVTLGFYKSRQEINTEWLWTSHLLEVRGDGNAGLLDVRTASGQTITQNGTAGFGATFFGNCCRRVYDVTYDTNAPFLSGTFKLERLTLDASVRGDFGKAQGQIFGAELGGGRVGIRPTDINGDGVISPAEAQTSIVPLGNPAPVDYSYDYLSYSFGVNYLLQDTLSLFARYSRGARANADRLLFNDSLVSTTTGALRNPEIAVDFVRQLEVGLKYQASGLFAYATGFYAKTEEQNFEATTQRLFDRSYRAYGLELEAGYRFGAFSFSGGATYTDAEITNDNITPANAGNRPRRQAKFVYQLNGQYESRLFTLGANLVGTTSSFAQDNNLLRLPGFAQVNTFLLIRPLERVQLSLNANNLFNTKGFTEAEEGAIPANGIVRARSINGRTLSAALRFAF